MSWAESRGKDKSLWSKEMIVEKVDQVNKVLAMLAKDEDFHDDLQMPIVKAAIYHWTGQNRLSPEKAAPLEGNRRVVFVLQKLQILQQVCREARMAVPIHLVINKITKLPDDIVMQTFSKELMSENQQSDSKPKEQAESKLDQEELSSNRVDYEGSGGEMPRKYDCDEPLTALTEELSARNKSGWPLGSYVSLFIVALVALIAISISINSK